MKSKELFTQHNQELNKDFLKAINPVKTIRKVFIGEKFIVENYENKRLKSRLAFDRLEDVF